MLSSSRSTEWTATISATLTEFVIFLFAPTSATIAILLNFPVLNRQKPLVTTLTNTPRDLPESRPGNIGAHNNGTPVIIAGDLPFITSRRHMFLMH